MQRFLLTLSFICMCSSACCAQFFPEKSLDTDNRGDSFKAQWYSRHLQALGEPSLFELSRDSSVESYRFLWLRSFHHPIAIRITRQLDGSFQIIAKMADGAGGYALGKVTMHTVRTLTSDEAQKFLSCVERSGFWNAPNPVDDQRGADGSQWIIEAVKGGKYHVIDRWSPHKGPARDLGLVMVFDLGKMEIPKDERY